MYIDKNIAYIKDRIVSYGQFCPGFRRSLDFKFQKISAFKFFLFGVVIVTILVVIFTIFVVIVILHHFVTLSKVGNT